MKLFLILPAILFLVFTTQAQTGKDTIFVQTYPDSVCLWNINIPATCGTSYLTSVSIVGDSIAILESDTSTQHFRCICSFNINVTFTGLAVGSYRAFVFRSGLSHIDTSFVGSVDFTIEQFSPLELSINSYGSGCHEIVNVSDEGTEIPKTFSLLGNYPNPFNPTTIIRYQIHQRSKVKLEIIDGLGQSIATLVNEDKPVGDYEIPWNAAKLSSGIYLCKLTAGNKIQTHKMTLVK